MLDEAVTGLDAGTRAGVYRLLQIVKAEQQFQVVQRAISRARSSRHLDELEKEKTKEAIAKDLQRRAEEESFDGQRAVIMSTRLYDEAEFYADRIALLLAGRVLITDVPERIKSVLGAGYELVFQMPTQLINGTLISALFLLFTVHDVF